MATITAQLTTAQLWVLRHRRWSLAALVLFALVFPLLVRLRMLNTYSLSLAMDVLIYALFAMSLDLLLGYTGLVSFGHAAFFGLGAYILAYLSTRLTSNLLLTVPLVLLGTALAALVIGYFAVRTRGIYFLMVTLAFGQMLFSIAISWSSVTGGSDGLTGVQNPFLGVGPWNLTMDTRESFYFLTLVLFLLSWWLLRRIVNSPFGWTLRGIRENESRLRALGVNTFRFKLASFVIGGAFAGLAGLLLAHSASIASPENLYWTTSGQALIMLIVGGPGTLTGPMLGAAAVRLLQNFASTQTERWETFMGLVFIAFVLFLRGGLISLFGKESQRHLARRP